MRRSCTAIFLLLALCLSLPAFADIGSPSVPDLLQGDNGMGSQLSSTPLGSAAADAIRRTADSDIAILSGGCILHNLEGGPTDRSRLSSVFSSDLPLYRAQISPAQLKEILEASLSHILVDERCYIDQDASRFEGFPQISGFTVEADASAPVGSRVRSVTPDGAGALDLTDTSVNLTLAADLAMLNGTYGTSAVPAEPLDLTLIDAMMLALENEQLTVPASARIHIIGTKDDKLIDRISPFTLVVIMLLFVGYCYTKNTKMDFTRKNARNEKGYDTRRKWLR